MPTYAVTGASGHLGRLAVQELLARGVPASAVVAVVRTRGKADDLADRGVQVREADYARPETLGAALAGVERLLLVSSSEPGQRAAHHINVIQAAKTAGTSRIVYTSMLNVDDTTNPLAGEHQDSERALREADVPFTLLRNSWYTENYTDQLGPYLDAGDLETNSQDLAQLLGRPATLLTEVVGAAHDVVLSATRDSRQHSNAARSATAAPAVN